METGGCDVTGVLLSNQECYIMQLDICTVSLHIWLSGGRAGSSEGPCLASGDPLNTLKVKGHVGSAGIQGE